MLLLRAGQTLATEMKVTQRLPLSHLSLGSCSCSSVLELGGHRSVNLSLDPARTPVKAKSSYFLKRFNDHVASEKAGANAQRTRDLASRTPRAFKLF